MNTLKSAEEWGSHFMLEPMTDNDDSVRLKWNEIRAIQANCFRAAAEIIKARANTFTNDSASFGMVHGLASLLSEEAQKLEVNPAKAH